MQSVTTPRERAGGRILLVHGHEGMREYITAILNDYEIEVMADAATALDRARERNPDLVLADVRLSAMDDFALLRQLRADAPTRDLPIVLLSEAAAEQARVEGLEAGASDYLVTPFTARELHVRVQTALELAALRRQTADSSIRADVEDMRLRLAAIVESSDDVIISKDMSGVITSWNRAAERLYGYEADEMVGKSISALIPPDHTDDFPGIMQRLRRGERIEHYETVRLAKDGRRIDVSLTISPIKNAAGHIIGASKIARDISERKRAEAAARRHIERTRLLWETASVLLTADEPDARLRGLFADIAASLGIDAYLNYRFSDSSDPPRLVSWDGVPKDSAGAVSRLEFGESVGGRLAPRRTPIIASRVQDSDDPMLQSIKEAGIRAYASTPLLAGERLLGTLSFASRRNDVFEPDEVEFLQTISHYVTSAYERWRLIEQLRDQDRLKDEFLATLAHELRNPLAPIRTGVQLIRMAGHNPALIEKTSPMMERQVQHMVRLVDDLLDVSRINRNKLELRKERIELGAVIQSALETSRPLIEAASHQLTVSVPSEPIRLEADGVRLSQALSNLLNNAAKYTPEGGCISLTAGIENGGVIIRVRDNGMGIPRDKLPRIFEMFVQVDRSVGQSQGGLGIGLSLANRLVQMHGGTIAAHSEGTGKGSEFVVRLPAAIVTTQSPNGQPDDRDSERVVSRRILVVDDNRDSADALATMLKLLGHDVTTAHDGLAAVESVRTFQPDVALLDLGMPHVNGYDAARLIRQQPGGDGVFLVALTGWGHDADRRRSSEAGFDAHLVKPADVAAIEQLLNRCRV